MCAQQRLRSAWAVWSIFTGQSVGSQGYKDSSGIQHTDQPSQMCNLISFLWVHMHSCRKCCVPAHFYQNDLSQHRTKPKTKLVQPAKTQISLHICTVWSVFADSMCPLQPPGYPKRDEREPLPYWMDIQANPSLCWSHRSYCRFCRALAHLFRANVLNKNNYYIRASDKRSNQMNIFLNSPWNKET